MGVVLLLVHALAGCSLPLELSSFGRAWEDDICLDHQFLGLQKCAKNDE